MPRMITRLKSKNLLGETPKEQRERLKRVRMKMISDALKKDKLPDPAVLREVKEGGKLSLLGTSKFQRRNRKKLLKKYS